MKALKKLFGTTLKLVLLVGLAGGTYYAYQQYTAEAEDEDLGELTTVVAEVRDITVSVSATGVLQPVRIVEIKSKASGEILQMPVEMGDFLRAGDLIAQVDTRILDQELKQAEADFESARIRLEIAGKQFDRAESLRAQDLISENDLEASKQSYSSAESAFIRAEASLELARDRLADTMVRAPISGTVIAKSVEQGQIIASSTNNVSGGTVLLQMADLSELEIRTLVDEIDIGDVKPGLRVESTVEAFADMRFEGEVMKIEPQAVVQQSVTTFPVLSRIDNSEGLLLPGMNADVSIIIHERPGVLAVANEAIRSVENSREVIRLLALDEPQAGAAVATTVADVATTPSSVDAEKGNEKQAVSGENERAANARGDHGKAASGGADNGNAELGEATNGEREAMRERMRNASPEERERMMAEMGGRRGSAARDDLQSVPASREDRAAEDVRREPGVVFMMGADGRITARRILVGVRDWEVSEVLEGLEPGDELVLLPSNSLLRSQQSARERYMRRSAVVPGTGR